MSPTKAGQYKKLRQMHRQTDDREFIPMCQSAYSGDTKIAKTFKGCIFSTVTEFSFYTVASVQGLFSYTISDTQRAYMQYHFLPVIGPN